MIPAKRKYLPSHMLETPGVSAVVFLHVRHSSRVVGLDLDSAVGADGSEGLEGTKNCEELKHVDMQVHSTVVHIPEAD